MSLKVLIADDEPNIVISLEFMMKREGYEVLVARDGWEALQAIRRERPQLVLLDVDLPGAAGIGPYSGKETLALAAWLGAWLILHFALRGKDLEISRWFIVFLVGVGIATTLIWPPVFEYLAGH